MAAAFLVVFSGCSSTTQVETPAANPGTVSFSRDVSASGVIVPEKIASLSVNTPGVVELVEVGEGEAVIEGQLLLQIKGGERAKATVATAQLELINAQNALNNLFDNTNLVAANALKSAEDAEDALEDLLNPELQEALALQAIADAEKAVEDTERVLNYALSTADQADIEIQQASVTLAKDALEKAIEDFEPYENKPEDNLIRANFLARKAVAQQAYDDAVRKLNALLGTGSDIDIAVARADFATAQAQLIEAQRDWERVQEGPSPGEIALLEAQIAAAYDDYETYQNGPDPDDIAVAEARITNAEAQLNAAESTLDDLTLLAPFDGVISVLNINPNEWVAPGQPVMILADLDHLQVETTDLSEIDVAKIKVGDSATVSFDALPDLVLTGTITRIPPKASEGSGVTYTVIIELDELPDELRWGMTAFIDIPQDQ